MKLNEILEIKDYLNLDNPEKYDFSNEGASIKYCEEKNAIDKYFIYRSGGEFHKLEDNNDNKNKPLFNQAVNKRKEILKNVYDFEEKEIRNKMCLVPVIKDPDSDSKLLQKIYSLLWDMESIPNCMKNCIKIQGETLNSVNTTLNIFYSMQEDETEKQERENLRISNKYVLSKYLTKSDDIKKKLNYEEIKKFLSIYHTIGNFMPVPNGCNGPRGIGPLHDYWDLTLLNIYNYYIYKNYKGLELIVGSENTTNYKAWLDTFGKNKEGWYNFVESNYLKAFVKDKVDNYYPKELWKDHFKQETSVLPNKDQCLEYFKNAADFIEKRSNQMLDVLRKK